MYIIIRFNKTTLMYIVNCDAKQPYLIVMRLQEYCIGLLNNGMNYMEIQQLVSFLTTSLIIACVPGANNLLSFQNGASWGIRVAMFAILGRCLAYAVMIWGVIAGLGHLLEASDSAMLIIKWFGVIYLSWIGIKMVRSCKSIGYNLEEGEYKAESTLLNILVQARKEFVVAISNPKAILLFSALLPQFVLIDSVVSGSTQLAILGVVYGLVEWGTASVYAIFGKMAVRGSNNGNRLKIIQLASGILMILTAWLFAFTK
ncbi:LysE family translocator [Vibrio sp. CDRSL-10 TSBA]